MKRVVKACRGCGRLEVESVLWQKMYFCFSEDNTVPGFYTKREWQRQELPPGCPRHLEHLVLSQKD